MRYRVADLSTIKSLRPAKQRTSDVPRTGAPPPVTVDATHRPTTAAKPEFLVTGPLARISGNYAS